MCIRLAKLPKLVNLHDALCQGATLADIGQCACLGQGFVACNMLLELAEVLTPVIGLDLQIMAGDVTYAVFHEIWRNDDRAAAERVMANIAREEGPLLDHNPWRVINRWLALQSLIPGILSPVSTARTAFEGVFREPASLSASPDRSTEVMAAFDAWFNRWAGLLLQMLGNVRGELDEKKPAGASRLTGLQPPELDNVLVQSLTISLEKETAVTLTVRKNQQLEGHIRQLTRQFPGPDGLPTGWIIERYNRMVDAWEERRDLPLAVAELRQLGVLLDWIDKHELDRKHGVELLLVRELARQTKATRLGFDQHATFPLAEVMREWDRLAMLLRMRRLPVDWADHRRVEDLFGHPLMKSFRFTRWHRQAKLRGLTEEVST